MRKDCFHDTIQIVLDNTGCSDHIPQIQQLVTTEDQGIIMIEPPNEWPSEIKESYDPIRILGKGGFASVVLAREKSVTTHPSNDNRRSNNRKVAIKVVGSIHETDINLTASHIRQERDRAILYARREIEILKHIRHHNIVQLFHHWIAEEEDGDNDGMMQDEKKVPQRNELTAAVLVLEYAKGPTVESLLKHGGALSTAFGQVIIAQAMDAIAYLHCHAVLHRDIKPDNILGESFDLGQHE